MTLSPSLDVKSALNPWLDRIKVAPQILVGYSGGLDSALLLKLLCETIGPQRIGAVHINHGLSPNADRWQAHAANFCQQIGVSFHAEKVTVERQGQGLEAAARHVRYTVFKRLLQHNGLLFLAQHADDQVETMVYRMLRGAGVKGLSGMPTCRTLGAGTLIRPLLSWRKSELYGYAQWLGLQWVEDESNKDNRFDRNYLRNRVIPVIAERWPNYAQSMQHSARLSDEAQQLNEVLAKEDMEDVDLRRERAGWSICIRRLMTLSSLRQKNILRYWSDFNHLAMPNARIIDEIMASVICAKQDATPKVRLQHQQWARFQGRLYLLKGKHAVHGTPANHPLADDQLPIQWLVNQTLTLPDGSQLHAEKVVGRGLYLRDNTTVHIDLRRGGERCTPAGRVGSNRLKKLFLEYGLQPWWRDRIPLLYVDNRLIAVGDLWVCEGWCARGDQQGLAIKWQVDSF